MARLTDGASAHLPENNLSDSMAGNVSRRITYLRVSVTDRCNLRCRYCMPVEGIPKRSHDEMLRSEEIARLVAVATRVGIAHVRITGGEPLVRKGVVNLVDAVSRLPGIEHVSLTTNGTLLEPVARPLAKAGLVRVNVSLDTLDPVKYAVHTRGGTLDDVLRGIHAAEAAGLQPVKINVVAMKGVNDEEILDFAEKTRTEGWHVRFIELMPFGEAVRWAKDAYLSTQAIREILETQYGGLLPGKVLGSGPAQYWRIAGAEGTLGFISPISGGYCGVCNRLRLTADGRLVPCLAVDDEIDVRTPLRSGASDETLLDLFRHGVERKPWGKCLSDHNVSRTREMSRTGG